MSGVCDKIRNGLKSFDVFNDGPLLRYNSDSHYQTTFGGIITILTVIVVIAASITNIIEVVGKQTVIWSSQLLESDESVTLNLVDNGFMIGINLQNIPFNTPKKYFSIQLSTNVYQRSTLVSTTNIPLNPCTADQWLGFQKQFYQNNISTWLCPPKNQNLQLLGKISETNSQIVTLSVSKCENSTNNGTCASEDQINALFTNGSTYLGAQYIGFNFINAKVSPNETQNYLTYQLNTDHYVPFNLKTHYEGLIEFKEFNVQTDTAILGSNFVNVTGANVDTPIQNIFDPLASYSSDNYANIRVQASSFQTNVNRSFQKLTTLIAYIGGLIGSILGALFFLKSFNSFAFELEFTSRITQFCHDEQSPNFQECNFWNYLKYKCYSMLKPAGIIKTQWLDMEIYQEYQRKACLYLDIEFILQKLIYIERTISLLFNQSQFQTFSYIFNHQSFRNLEEKNAKIFQTGRKLRTFLKEKSHKKNSQDIGIQLKLKNDKIHSKERKFSSQIFQENQTSEKRDKKTVSDGEDDQKIIQKEQMKKRQEMTLMKQMMQRIMELSNQAKKSSFLTLDHAIWSKVDKQFNANQIIEQKHEEQEINLHVDHLEKGISSGNNLKNNLQNFQVQKVQQKNIKLERKSSERQRQSRCRSQ